MNYRILATAFFIGVAAGIILEYACTYKAYRW